MTILIWISVLSLVVISIVVGTRLTAIRDGKITVIEQSTLFSILQEKIDWFAVVFVLSCRDLLKFVSLKTLMFLKRGASYLKVFSIKFEKRFSRVIDMVHGKGAVSKKGAVSFFLREIKDHNDKVKVRG